MTSSGMTVIVMTSENELGGKKEKNKTNNFAEGGGGYLKHNERVYVFAIQNNRQKRVKKK